MTKVPVATVFGSASVFKETPAYDLAVEIGGALAKKGFAVANRGGGGIMEAAHRGAHSQGGHTIAVATQTGADQEITMYALERRVVENSIACTHTLYEIADIIVVFPGGIGTLRDLAYAWNMRQYSARPKPILLVGTGWPKMLQGLQANLDITSEQLKTLEVLHDAVELEEQIDRWLGEQARTT